jgi:2'-5' RNA ligase
VTHTESTTPTSLTHLRDHWQWRPEWGVDRACLLWYLTFDSQPDLSRQAGLVRACLSAVDQVDVVPVPWLHLTLDDVGFADEVAPAHVAQVVESARAAVVGWTPPVLTLGPLAPMDDSVVLEAGPVAELVALRNRLRVATTTVLGPDRPGHLDEFRPHVTLAYLNDASPPDAVMGPLSCLAAAQPVVAEPRLTLASVTRRDRHYQWTSRAELALTPATGVA